MTDRLTLAVVTAGLSEDSTTTRLGEAIAQSASGVVENAGQHVDIKVIQLRDLAHGLTDMMITHVASRAVQDAIDTVLTADGLIAASPTYKASYSGLFKQFFDVIDESALENLPTVVAATGGSPRHSLVLETAMRPLLSYLKALVLPLGIYAASEDWGHNDLQRRIDRVGASLGTMLLAGSRGGDGSDGTSHGDAARPGLRREVKDEFGDVPDFASLLASVGS
ncbi:CE1759 family FMN reductase [Kocuria marina]|uniref:CE1759 family FMN reductase n=1 Tax=Kocuria marina TaxID=223184 RepID=UPI0011A9CD59|nr:MULTISPECIES: CE1759 family FMN reductase [Kocuria]MCT2020321.1 NAD(P)H-dependent oxidoreductase [Kocuria marina]